MNTVQQEADRIYKEHYGKMVASLLYSSRAINLETAEDIVQDSFSAAITDWSSKGIPLNAAGWIYRVCRNKAINQVKKVKHLSEEEIDRSVEIKFSESLIDDHKLKMLFACAHPDLSPKVQVVITLKYVVNLKVEAIANIMAMTIDGIDKLLLRARQKIKDEKILLEEPESAAWKPRLRSVHKIIYLVFNEGYKSSWGKEIMREELCEEALILNKYLLDSGLANKDTSALQSLMLFNIARFKSRFGSSGEILDLENQDRSQWNRELIDLGCDYLTRSRGEILSTYHLEASIACVHCSAKNFSDTDWGLIAKLYGLLLKNNPNPFVELNYSIALYYAGEKQSAFERLHALGRHPFIGKYFLLNAALGKFYYAEGNHLEARQFLTAAYEQAGMAKEKEFIMNMLDANK